MSNNNNMASLKELIDDYLQTAKKMREADKKEQLAGEAAVGKIRNCTTMMTKEDRAHFMSQIQQADLREDLQNKRAKILRHIEQIASGREQTAIKLFVFSGMSLEDSINLACSDLGDKVRRDIVKKNVQYLISH